MDFVRIFFIILSFQITIIHTASTAVCFLTVQPAPETLHFAEELALGGIQHNIDVFVIVDDNSYKVRSARSSIVKTLQIPNEQCIIHGYYHLMHVDTRPMNISAWDKGLLHFCKLASSYSFVWFIEDDVFIPSIDAFLAVHELYSHKSDLIVQQVEPNLEGNTEGWPHWYLAYGKLVPPWFRSMVNAVGLSRRLLKTIDDYILWRGVGTYHEYLLQTLSLNQNMTVISPTELDTLEWVHNYNWEDIERKPGNWYHPVKNLSNHIAWRKQLVKMKRNIKNNIQWFQLKPVCNNSQNSEEIRKYLQELILSFNQNKIHMIPEERRSLRQHFLCLAQECQAQQDFISVAVMVESLADNAYKLPEPSWVINVNKSSFHMILEQELEQNKRYIFNLSKYIDLVKWFRELATNITIMLTTEIQREMKQLKFQPQTNKLNVVNTTLKSCSKWSAVPDVHPERRTSSAFPSFLYNHLQALFFLVLAVMLRLFSLVRLSIKNKINNARRG